MVRSEVTPPARALGIEIRAARTRYGISGRELARRLKRDPARISRYETGHLTPSEVELGAVLGILEVSGEQHEQCIKLVREANDPNWLSPGTDRQLKMLMEYERSARSITEISPLLIPGLLQTGEYARSIMRAAGATSGEVEQRVNQRMGRRDVLERTSPKPAEMNALISDSVLRHPACAESVMVDQLRYLVKCAERPNVEIRVVPTSVQWTPMHTGPFILMQFDDAGPVVHIEHYRTAVTLTDQPDVDDFVKGAELVKEIAMSATASVALIAEIADNMGEPA